MEKWICIRTWRVRTVPREKRITILEKERIGCALTTFSKSWFKPMQNLWAIVKRRRLRKLDKYTLTADVLFNQLCDIWDSLSFEYLSTLVDSMISRCWNNKMSEEGQQNIEYYINRILTDDWVIVQVPLIQGLRLSSGYCTLNKLYRIFCFTRDEMQKPTLNAVWIAGHPIPVACAGRAWRTPTQ